MLETLVIFALFLSSSSYHFKVKIKILFDYQSPLNKQCQSAYPR